LQNRTALKSARTLALVDVTVRLLSTHGTPFPGVGVRALHTTLDVSCGPEVTDGRGAAKLRLPKGLWRLDLATDKPRKGHLVFARTDLRVREGGEEIIELDKKRRIRFRSRLGAVRSAHIVILSWPDLSYYKRVDVRQGQFEIATLGEEPMILQAVRRPGAEGGYVLRQGVGIDLTEIETDPEAGETYRFMGSNRRELSVRITSADALPYELAFAAKRSRKVFLSGLTETVVGLDVKLGKRRYGFLPRPFALGGGERTFSGAPPFEASVGFRQCSDHRYGNGRNSISMRVFLREPNGLVLRWARNGAYRVAWEQVLDGRVLAAGTTFPPMRILTPPVDPAHVGRLRYRLRIMGPGEDRKVEVSAHTQTTEVRNGQVRLFAFPEMAANARMWAGAVHHAVRAYERTCPRRRSYVNIKHSLHFPGNLAGMGGYGGNVGWMWLPEHPIYGFAGQTYWTGLLAHELGHVYSYWHSNPDQTRRMQQAGRRAGRKLRSIRPGMAREPEGNRFLPLMEAVTRGEIQLEREFDDEQEIPILRKTAPLHEAAPGDGILVPNLEITGDDAAFTWYYLSVFGGEADLPRRHNGTTWSWWLVCKGYSDPEIQIAMMSHAAGTSLGWLARMRGIEVHDHRIDGAMKELKEARGGGLDQSRRAAIAKRWREESFESSDLTALKASMLAELGVRSERVNALVTIARGLLIRGEEEEGRRSLLDALAEARRGSATLFQETLDRCAVLWAAR
jgi:hypothetical protein